MIALTFPSTKAKGAFSVELSDQGSNSSALKQKQFRMSKIKINMDDLKKEDHFLQIGTILGMRRGFLIQSGGLNSFRIFNLDPPFF